MLKGIEIKEGKKQITVITDEKTIVINITPNENVVSYISDYKKDKCALYLEPSSNFKFIDLIEHDNLVILHFLDEKLKTKQFTVTNLKDNVKTSLNIRDSINLSFDMELFIKEENNKFIIDAAKTSLKSLVYWLGEQIECDRQQYGEVENERIRRNIRFAFDRLDECFVTFRTQNDYMHLKRTKDLEFLSIYNEIGVKFNYGKIA